MVGMSSPASAAVFTVNSVADAADFGAPDGACDTDPGTPGEQCTLRAAVGEANALGGADRIAFNLTAGTTIQPFTALPEITSPVTLDGLTQPTGKVELNGASAGSANGLVVSAGSSVIRGLVINRFGQNGIRLVTAGGNTIEANYIGTDSTGNVDLGNSSNGISVETGSSANT